MPQPIALADCPQALQIAGAEIVHGDAHAQRPPPVQRVQGRFVVGQQQALGDLELQPRRWQAGLAQRRQNRLERGVVPTRGPDHEMEESWEAAPSPFDALDRLDGVVEAAVVAGGIAANAAFLREGLVDDVTLFVEAMIIPAGLPQVPSGLADIRCRLASARALTDSVARLDFTVMK